jgi:hypothetical protein
MRLSCQRALLWQSRGWRWPSSMPCKHVTWQGSVPWRRVLDVHAAGRCAAGVSRGVIRKIEEGDSSMIAE